MDTFIKHQSMTYTALTTGPIVASLDQAHKTREIWAASYLLSHLMERTIHHLMTGQDAIRADQFVVPYPKVRALPTYNAELKRAGVFPDRLILESENGLFDQLQNAVKEAKDEIAADFEKIDGIENAKQYLDQYFRTDIVEMKATEKNVVVEINQVMANCELQNTLISKDDLYFTTFLEKIHGSTLFNQVFEKGYSYPSMLEIGIRKLNGGQKISRPKREDLMEIGERILKENAKPNDKEKLLDDDDKLLAGLKKSEGFKDKLKTAHKYVAIVQADGDNVGKLIESIYLNNPGKIKDFSKALSNFSLRSVEAIMAYGGEPVYAGGDDLLFFAPVVTHDDQIFGLLKKLDDIFNGEVVEESNLKGLVKGLEKSPSMSYGVSVTYYKYPMHEALRAGRHLLFGKAKSGSKNAIAYRLQKHSGQSFDDVLNKDSDFYKALMEMLTLEDNNLISSLLYNLEMQKSSLGKIAGDKVRLDHFFKNSYNEEVHQSEAADAFIEKVKKLIYLAYTQESGNDIEKALSKTYSALRFIKFLNRKNDE